MRITITIDTDDMVNSRSRNVRNTRTTQDTLRDYYVREYVRLLTSGNHRDLQDSVHFANQHREYELEFARAKYDFLQQKKLQGIELDGGERYEYYTLPDKIFRMMSERRW